MQMRSVRVRRSSVEINYTEEKQSESLLLSLDTVCLSR